TYDTQLTTALVHAHHEDYTRAVSDCGRSLDLNGIIHHAVVTTVQENRALLLPPQRITFRGDFRFHQSVILACYREQFAALSCLSRCYTYGGRGIARLASAIVEELRSLLISLKF